MAATILAGHLLAAVRIAKMATMRRNTIPVLSNVLIAIGADFASVVGTDMEQTVCATAVAAGDLAPITVPAERLAAMLSRLPAETELILAYDAELARLRITGGGLKAALLTLPSEDFPQVGRLAEALRFSMPAPSLRRLLDLPSHAISTEETRYYLNGAYLHVVQDQGGPLLRTVATDGHRLMAADMPVPVGAATLAGVIVPRNAIRILRMLLPGRTDGLIEVFQGEKNKLVFKGGPWTVHTKVIDGTFPEYARVMPARKASAARIDVKLPRALMQSAAMAAAISTERSRPLKFSNGSGVALKLEASSPDAGTTEVAVPEDAAAWNEGVAHPEVGVQARYLRDACLALPRGFSLQVIDSHSPIRIDFEGGGFGALMPMRV